MSDYSNTFGGAAHDTAEDTIQGVDFDTQFDAVATMSASKANKKVPATTSNLATLDSGGDLGDSLESVTTLKSYAKRGAIYLDAATTSSTISFSGTTISRTAGTIDLSVFKKGDVITITGTTLNNTSYTLASDASASSITTTASTTAESGQVPVFTTDGVVEVLDEDDMATDSASSVPSQQSAKAYSDSKISTDPSGTGTLSTGGTMEVFVSTLETYSGGGFDFTPQSHGLSGNPHEFHSYARCTAAGTSGFTVDDTVPIDLAIYSNLTNSGFTAWASETQVGGHAASGGVRILDKANATFRLNDDSSTWDIFIVAKYYA